MFHLMLVFMPVLLIVAFVVIISLVLFGVVSVLASILGGASVAVLVKNRTIKYLLLVGFSILLFVGALCLLPVIVLATELSANLFAMAAIILSLIDILAIVGIKLSTSLRNKIGKVVLVVLFSLVGVVAAALTVLSVLQL